MTTLEHVATTENEVEYYNPILGTAGLEARQSFFEELWRLDNVIVLLGAGFSKAIGGPLIEDLSRKILPGVIMSGYTPIPGEDRRERWENLWEIDSALQTQIKATLPTPPACLEDHCATLNIEKKIGTLQVIISAQESLNIRPLEKKIYSAALDIIKKKILEEILLITPKIDSTEYTKFTNETQRYREFFKKLLQYRRPQQPRIKFFTTNYDLVVESVCDMEGIRCITGFEGITVRVLNPVVFDLETSFRSAGQTSIFYPNVVHLYKLHGSIDWTKTKINGVTEIIQTSYPSEDVIIYPCHTKFAESLEAPYYEMFRRFGSSLLQPQTVVLTIGYGFNDDHVNQVLLTALKNPSCQLVACVPDIQSNQSLFLKALTNIALGGPGSADNRITILSGNGSKFPVVLDILFPERKIEDPLDQVKAIIQRLIEFGGANK